MSQTVEERRPGHNSSQMDPENAGAVLLHSSTIVRFVRMTQQFGIIRE